MIANKSYACRKEIETLQEYDMIEPSKSPWACGVVMVKKKEDQLRFCCYFRYLSCVTVKDAYPIPRRDRILSNWGAQNFSQLSIWGRPFGRCHLGNKTGTKQGLLASGGSSNGRGCPLASALRQPHFSD